MGPKQKKAPAKKSKGAEAAGSSKPADCPLTRAPFEEVRSSVPSSRPAWNRPRLTCSSCVQESWRVCVSMIVGSGADEEDLSRCLLSAVQQPIRAHFTLLTWDGVLEKVGAPCASFPTQLLRTRI